MKSSKSNKFSYKAWSIVIKMECAHYFRRVKKKVKQIFLRRCFLSIYDVILYEFTKAPFDLSAKEGSINSCINPHLATTLATHSQMSSFFGYLFSNTTII